MKKKILLGFLFFCLLGIIGSFVFMANFEIFDEPTDTELKTECDYEGLRKIIMIQSDGNAVSNRSIRISATECNSEERKNNEPIFVVDGPNLKPADISFKWKNFDTLTITYNKTLRVFKQETESKTVDPKIIFEYIAK